MSAEKSEEQDSEDMARGRHGFGTYDRSTKTWKLRTKELRADASIRKLSQRFGIDLPADERATYPYWRKYLDEVRAVSVLKDRETRLAIAQLLFDTGGNPTLLAEFEQNPITGKIQFRVPLDPEVERLANMAYIGDYAGMASVLKKHEIPKTESLRAEVEQAIERSKKKGGQGWYSVRLYLNFFADSCGKDIRLSDISVLQYREFLKNLDANEKWNATTKHSAKKKVDIFLRRVEADHNLAYGFLRNKDYRLQCPEGRKAQWTVDEVRKALATATGVARAYLLLGLNCGFYPSDIAALTPDKFDGSHINAGRVKNRKHGASPFVGSWKLWPETVAALQYGLTEQKLGKAFTKFREEEKLPEGSDLRKTVGQLLQDHVSEEVARLYRCEKVGGVHGSHYIRFSDEQKAKLDAGLDVIREMLFGKS